MSLMALHRMLLDRQDAAAVIAWRRGKALDFGQLRAAAAAVAAKCVGRKRVALICEDAFLFTAGLFGVLMAGAELVLPPNCLPGTLDALADSVELVIDDAFIIQAASERSIWAAPIQPIDADAAQITFFTSGSTGVPKRVTRSLAMLQHEILAINRAFGGLPGRGTILSTVSHQHLYGLTFRLLWPLASGRAFNAETLLVWETVMAADPGGGVVVSSPAHLSRLGGLPTLEAASRPSAVFSAGAPLAAADAQLVNKVLGALPIEIFGSTESGAR